MSAPLPLAQRGDPAGAEPGAWGAHLAGRRQWQEGRIAELWAVAGRRQITRERPRRAGPGSGPRRCMGSPASPATLRGGRSRRSVPLRCLRPVGLCHPRDEASLVRIDARGVPSFVLRNRRANSLPAACALVFSLAGDNRCPSGNARQCPGCQLRANAVVGAVVGSAREDRHRSPGSGHESSQPWVGAVSTRRCWQLVSTRPAGERTTELLGPATRCAVGSIPATNSPRCVPCTNDGAMHHVRAGGAQAAAFRVRDCAATPCGARSRERGRLAGLHHLRYMPFSTRVSPSNRSTETRDRATGPATDGPSSGLPRCIRSALSRSALVRSW